MRGGWVVAGALGLALVALGMGAPPSSAAEEGPPPERIGAVPIYVPPDVGLPGGRLGGGTRGGEVLPQVFVLAPDHVALTTSPEPTLYWYLSGDTRERIDLTLVDDASVEPLLEVTLPGPARAGIHAVRLADHGVRLKPDVTYRWSISIVPNPARRSNDVVSAGELRLRDKSPALEARLARVKGERDVFVYAEGGVWYDALDAVSKHIADAPGDARLREYRAALLDQVGLSQAAASDRGAPGG